MSGTCFKLKKLLLGPLLSKPPNKPAAVRVVPGTHSIEVSWKPGAASSAYNTDAYCVEVAPQSPELIAVLGAGPATASRLVAHSRTVLRPLPGLILRPDCSLIVCTRSISRPPHLA